MMSASPAWKPQAIFTDVARSIMAASLPISQAPNPSPRSQLRSMVVMLCPLARAHRLVRSQRVGWRRYLPCSGVDGTDGGARDVSITESLDVEIKLVHRTEPIGQGA